MGEDGSRGPENWNTPHRDKRKIPRDKEFPNDRYTEHLNGREDGTSKLAHRIAHLLSVPIETLVESGCRNVPLVEL